MCGPESPSPKSPSPASAQVRRYDFGLHHRPRVAEAHHLLMFVSAEPAKRNTAFLRFALANDQQQRDLGKAMLAHLVVDLLVTKVGLDANPRGFELRRDLAGIGVRLRDDGRHHRLNGRQPEGKFTGMM